MVYFHNKDGLKKKVFDKGAVNSQLSFQLIRNFIF